MALTGNVFAGKFRSDLTLVSKELATDGSASCILGFQSGEILRGRVFPVTELFSRDDLMASSFKPNIRFRVSDSRLLALVNSLELYALYDVSFGLSLDVWNNNGRSGAYGNFLFLSAELLESSPNYLSEVGEDVPVDSKYAFT